MNKRRAAWTLAGALALPAAALVAGEALGWPFLRDALQQQLQRRAGAAVRLDGDFQLRLLWRPTLRVQHLHIGSAPGVDAPYLLDAHHVDLGWRWSDVWRWRQGTAPLRVHRLHAQRLQAHLVRDREGRASWQFGAPSGDPLMPEWDLPRVGSLRVDNGLVRIEDAPWQTHLRVALSGGEAEQAGAGAGYRLVVEGRYRALPLVLKLQSGGALPLLQDPQADAPAADVPLRIEGQAGASWLLFEGRAGALLGERRLHGALRFRGPSLARVGKPLGLTLPETPAFSLQGQLGHAAGVWHLQVDRAAIGSSRLNGDFRLDTRVHPPQLHGRLGGSRIALADLGPAVGAPAAKPESGRVLPQRPFDLPSLHAMDADVQVDVEELDFGSDALNPLHDLRTRLVLNGGVLQLQELNAYVAGGRLRGSTSLDAHIEPARWTADLRFGAIDIAGWLAGLRPATAAPPPSRPDSAALKRQRQQARTGAAQPVRAYLTGTLTGAVKASGRGRSVAEILGTLDGRAQLMLREGSLSHLVTEALGLDVAEGLGVLARGDRPLPLRCGWLDLAVLGGVVQPQQAVIDNDDTEVRIGGQVDLRDETLALRLVARPKDVSPFTLRTPVTIGGTLADPQVGVEAAPLAGKALGAVVLGAAITPLAALLPFVDLGVGHEQDACARPPRAAVNDVRR